MLNAYFWQELKAEYLLFECLQDFTGGVRCFFLGCYCYLSDISDEGTRTRRFNFLDAVFNIGFMERFQTCNMIFQCKVLLTVICRVLVGYSDTAYSDTYGISLMIGLLMLPLLTVTVG